MAEAARNLENPSPEEPVKRPGLRSIQGGAKASGKPRAAGKLSVVPPEKAAGGPAAIEEAAATNAAPARPQIIQGGGEGDGQPAGQLKATSMPKAAAKADASNPPPKVTKASGSDTSNKPDASNDASINTGGGLGSSNSLASQAGPATGKAPAIGSKAGDSTGANTNAASPLPKLGGLGGKTKSARNFVRRHPKGLLWGIGALAGALIAVAIAIISIPLQLIHMVESLLDHNFAPGDRIEEKASRRVMARLFQEKTAENGGNRKATGHPISDKLANMKIDRFTKLLAQDNLKMTFDSNGRLTGIADIRDGSVLKDFSDSSFAERRTAIGDLVSERIAPWRVLKRVKYTRIMRFHARVSFKFFAKEAAQKIKDTFLEKVRQGATTDELVQDNTDPKTTDAAAATDGADDAKGAVKTAESTFAKTKNKALAIREGVKAFRASSVGKAVGITGILALVCTVKEMADKAATKGYIDRADDLIRMGNVLPTIVSQLHTGQFLDIDKFGAVMSVYTGDSSAPADSEDRKGWDQSAAAKRINNEPVDSDPKSANYNPDFSGAANPNGFELKKIVDVVDEVFNDIPGANFVCKVATGFWGFVLQAVEAVVAVVSGGTEAAAAIAVQVPLQFAVFGVIVPQVLAAAASLAVTGTENSVDSFTNGDAGLQLSAQDYNRNFGGRQISDNEQVALVNDANAEKVQVAKENGWLYRTFNLDNTDSVASNVLMKIPTNPSSAIAAITNMPHTLTSMVGDIFLGKFHNAFADDASTVNPYHFQFYGFTQAELDKYPDPIANENYLAQQVPGQPTDGTGKTRLSVLGDYSQYTPADGEDTNNDDLMHCFVNKYRSPEDLAADPICAGIGSITSPDGSGSATNNPGNAAVAQIYAKAGLNATIDDDFLRYRMEMLYIHETQGIECQSTDDDCLAGNGQAATTNAPTGQIDPSTLYQDSSSIACAAGTVDAGIQDGYHDNILVKIRTCELPNMPQAGGPNGHAQVNSRVSAAFYNLIQAAKGANIPMSSDSSFRTMAQQQQLWAQLGQDPAVVASPGTSNHQMGLAIDFGGVPKQADSSNAIFSWLTDNAGTYGIKNYPAEGWHWSPTGN